MLICLILMYIYSAFWSAFALKHVSDNSMRLIFLSNEIFLVKLNKI